MRVFGCVGVCVFVLRVVVGAYTRKHAYTYAHKHLNYFLLLRLVLLNDMLSEQEINRRQKREELMRLGIDPYPAGLVDVTTTAADIRAAFQPGLDGPNGPGTQIDPEMDLSGDERWGNVQLAGRLMIVRISGSASFAELQDSTGRMQLYFRRDDLCPGDDKTRSSKSC